MEEKRKILITRTIKRLNLIKIRASIYTKEIKSNMTIIKRPSKLMHF